MYWAGFASEGLAVLLDVYCSYFCQFYFFLKTLLGYSGMKLVNSIGFSLQPWCCLVGLLSTAELVLLSLHPLPPHLDYDSVLDIRPVELGICHQCLGSAAKH